MAAQAQAQEVLEAGVGDVFAALASEMALAGEGCLKLDALVGDLMAALPPAERTRLVEGMHLVDLLSQELNGLAAFARAMSQDAAPHLYTPIQGALEVMTLGALADRMSSALGIEPRDAGDASDAGDLDFF